LSISTLFTSPKGDVVIINVEIAAGLGVVEKVEVVVVRHVDDPGA